MTNQKHLGLAKLYVCLSVLTTASLAFTFESSETQLRSLLVLLPLVVLGFMDAVINDLLPDQYESKVALRWRYLVFVGLAGVQMPLIYRDVLSDFPAVYLLRYALDAAGAAGVAVLDLVPRYRRARSSNEHTPASAP